MYPLSARDAHQQGTVIIHMHLRRDGTVLDASLVKSSGYAVLDEAARQEVLRIGKFAELPLEYIPGQADFAIDQPVAFRLR
ncbi:MAG: energy transducer TonB [Nevskia sp.]|nr:energy transducer TonB [Nevskia sp.]